MEKRRFRYSHKAKKWDELYTFRSDYWLDQVYTLVDGVMRNQIWVNNQAWINPAKYKELEPEEYKKLHGLGCYT